MDESKDFETAWREKLARSVESRLGKETADEIRRSGEGLTDRSFGGSLRRWTRETVSLLEGVTDPEGAAEIFADCSCQYPDAKIADLRELFRETGDLPRVHRELRRRFMEEIRTAKNLDEEHIAFLEEEGMGLAGRLEERSVTAVKIPKDFASWFQETDPEKRRGLYCHCPRVRDSVADGKTEKIPETYCYCGAGYYKALWEGIIEAPVKVTVEASVIKGDDRCRVRIDLPELGLPLTDPGKTG